jgi:hypothetical protein
MGSFSEIQLLIHTFNWHTPSWDLFILLFWLVASVLYAFSSGRGRILTILVSTYMAQLLVLKAPFLSDVLTGRLNIASGSLQQLTAFAALFIVFFVFLGRYAFKTSVDRRNMGSLAYGLIFSLLQVGLVINIVLGYLPEPVQNSFSPLIQFVFLHANSGFVWLALPVVFLIILGRFISEKSEM